MEFLQGHRTSTPAPGRIAAAIITVIVICLVAYAAYAYEAFFYDDPPTERSAHDFSWLGGEE